MSVLKINAITVDPDSGDELARRFAARAGAVDGQEGFEGFELLRPTDGRHVWLVVTRWRDEDAFGAWMNSSAFGQGHRGTEASSDQESAAGAGHGHGHEGAGQPAPVAVSSELWSYEVAGGSQG